MFNYFKDKITARKYELFDIHPQLFTLFFEKAWHTYYEDAKDINSDSDGTPKDSLIQPNPIHGGLWDIASDDSGKGILCSVLTRPNELIISSNNPSNTLTGISHSTDENSTTFTVRPWLHLIYAYLIENTRITQIFQRVIQRYRFGEELNIIKEPYSRSWLYTTEQLFFRDSPNFYSFSLDSYLRPDSEAARRNAYYRMFGMDLNHGTEANQAYQYPKAKAANKKFIAVFEKFLHEVWQGIQNTTNTSGANPTDKGTIENLVDELKDMMNDRRRYQNLEREEFFYTSMLSWFHIALLNNTPIVVDLDAQANSPDERLRKIGDKVGLPSHGKAKNLMELAEPLSLIFRMIERGWFKDPFSVEDLYTTGNLRDTMFEIITHWSIATGSDIKQGKLKSAA